MKTYVQIEREEIVRIFCAMLSNSAYDDSVEEIVKAAFAAHERLKAEGLRREKEKM